MQRAADPLGKTRQTQAQHHDQCQSDQHVNRPAVGEYPRQAQRIKPGTHMHQFTLHLCGKAHGPRPATDQRHQAQEHRDRGQGKRDL